MAPAAIADDCRRCGGHGTVSVYVGGMDGAIKCPVCTTPDDWEGR